MLLEHQILNMPMPYGNMVYSWHVTPPPQESLQYRSLVRGAATLCEHRSISYVVLVNTFQVTHGGTLWVGLQQRSAVKITHSTILFYTCRLALTSRPRSANARLQRNRFLAVKMAPMHISASKGQLHLVQAELDRGIDINLTDEVRLENNGLLTHPSVVSVFFSSMQGVYNRSLYTVWFSIRVVVHRKQATHACTALVLQAMLSWSSIS